MKNFFKGSAKEFCKDFCKDFFSSRFSWFDIFGFSILMTSVYPVGWLGWVIFVLLAVLIAVISTSGREFGNKQ